MSIKWEAVTNPIRQDIRLAYRDPVLFHHEGIYHIFYTVVEQEQEQDRYRLYMEHSRSTDLAHWEPAVRVADSPLNFSSPGNIVRAGGKWLLCVQSYPMEPGEIYGNASSRLWLMESADLTNWSEPWMIQESGCQAVWSSSPRQIDPYLVEYQSRYWCFYKAAGQLGALVSDNLRDWQEASPDRPVLSSTETPDGSTVENPCIVRDGEEFVLFFSPCRQGRGIGTARSRNLLDWSEVRYLDFPELAWAPGGPTAAMVLDRREACGKWLMAFHGDTEGPHGAALGLAWSGDLEHWHIS
ncbi:MAG: hypothetical protein K0R57_5631 [Paenibacillaceae bacterium]|jgi:hypothetical protein|nr:hypothetical protein [Paenibacillaceae bacterium]